MPALGRAGARHNAPKLPHAIRVDPKLCGEKNAHFTGLCMLRYTAMEWDDTQLCTVENFFSHRLKPTLALGTSLPPRAQMNSISAAHIDFCCDTFDLQAWDIENRTKRPKPIFVSISSCDSVSLCVAVVM